MKMYAIRDNKTEVFNNPFISHTDMSAMRTVYGAMDQNLLSTYPEDFSLWYLGEFDDVTGAITPEVPPKIVITLLEIKRNMERAIRRTQPDLFSEEEVTATEAEEKEVYTNDEYE